jgi:hypothetical protein
LGLPTGEFWDSTPRRVDRLTREYAKVEQRRDYRAGMIAATVRNARRTKTSQKFWQPHDFFPNLKPGQAKRMEPDEIRNAFLAVARQAQKGR